MFSDEHALFRDDQIIDAESDWPRSVIATKYQLSRRQYLHTFQVNIAIFRYQRTRRALAVMRVKVQWTASETYKLDSVFSQAQELGSNWIQGLPVNANELLIARLRSITSRDVQAVAARYFGDDQMTMATLMPQPADPNRKPRKPSVAAGAIRD